MCMSLRAWHAGKQRSEPISRVSAHHIAQISYFKPCKCCMIAFGYSTARQFAPHKAEWLKLILRFSGMIVDLIQAEAHFSKFNSEDPGRSRTRRSFYRYLKWSIWSTMLRAMAQASWLNDNRGLVIIGHSTCMSTLAVWY